MWNHFLLMAPAFRFGFEGQAASYWCSVVLGPRVVVGSASGPVLELVDSDVEHYLVNDYCLRTLIIFRACFFNYLLGTYY